MRNKRIAAFLFSGLLVLFASYAIARIATHRPLDNNESKLAMISDVDKEIDSEEDPWSEIEHLVSSYYHEGGVHYKGAMKLVDGNREDERIMEELKFDFTVVDNQFYCILGNFEYIQKDDLVLVVDHSLKEIAIANQPLQRNHQQFFFDPLEFKNILSQKGAIAKVSKSGADRVLTVDSIQDQSVQGYRIYYSPDTYRIKKIEIGMTKYSSLEGEQGSSDQAMNMDLENSGQVEDDTIKIYTYFLEISYAEAELLSLKKGEFAPEAKFIIRDDKTIQLVPAYKDYSLSNPVE
jgi:hypothetical protein